MALTAHQLALRMAKMIGITSFDPDDPSNTTPLHQGGLHAGDIDDLTACINAALQELWDCAPTAVRFARLSLPLRAPVAVILTVTEGSAAIAAFAGYESWMEGCTIRLEGAAMDNELVDGGTLLHPYMGPTDPGGSAVGAVVHADCVTPGPEVISVLDPIGICGSSRPPEQLGRAPSRPEFEADWGTAMKRSGTPRVCFVETHYAPSQGGLRIRIRVHPMPGDPMLLTFGGRLNAPAITAADLGTDSDPGTTFPVPGGWEESVLLPLALARLSTHPAFAPENVKTEIARQAVAARRIMLGAAPQRAAGQLLPTFR